MRIYFLICGWVTCLLAIGFSGLSQTKTGSNPSAEIAEFLRISLVTLNDWVNKGLPSHKQRGRVYFDRQEVKEYIKNHKMGEFRFGSRFKKIRQEIA